MDIVTLQAARAAAKKDGNATYAPLGSGSSLLRFKRLQPTVVTNFAPGHGWTVVSGAASSNLNDTTDGPFSGQCISLTTGGTGASAIIGATGVPALPAGRAYRLWLKFDTAETVAQVRLFASSDTGFTNYYSFATSISSAATPEAQRPYKAGEWVPVLFHWSTATTVGTPDRAALTNLRVLVNDRNPPAATVHYGRLEHVDYPASPTGAGAISLTYDDSFTTHYSVARLALAKYAYTATLFPILDRIGQAGFLTQAQVDELAAVHGWEIGAHATTLAAHQTALTGMTQAQRKAELAALRSYQSARGYNSSAYAYPSGLSDLATIADVGGFYSFARGAVLISDEVQVPSLPMRIQAVNPGALTLAQMKAHVDRAAAQKVWVIFVFHDLPASKTDANSITASDHNALIDYIASTGLSVVNLNQAMRASAG